MLNKDLLATLSLIWLALYVGHATAHPLDSYATDQYLDISMASGEVSLIHRIEFAEIPTVAELPKVDTDSDTTLSDEETGEYLAGIQEILSKELILRAVGQAVPLSYQRGEVLLQEIPTPRLKVITSYKGTLPSLPSMGIPFQFELKHRAGARGDRQIRLLCSGLLQLGSVWSSDPRQPIGMAPPVVTEATALVYGHTTKWVLLPSTVEHHPNLANLPTSSRALPLQPPDPFLSLNPRGFKVSTASQPVDQITEPLEQESFLVPSPLPGGTRKDSRSSVNISSSTNESSSAATLSQVALPEYSAGATSKPNRETWADSQFRGLFTSNRGGGMSFLLFATLLSLIYGAAHAMEPGHGKTIVAAYLVGSKGTVLHAVLLALIVTFTHTFSVYILGLIALTNLDKVQGTYLPWLECGSWALIVCMGLVLFLKYYRAYVIGDLADPNYHTHGFGHEHSHTPHFHEDHDHHHHDHEHEHHHPHDHEHPAEDDSGTVSSWNLLTLGVTGGIVPCPGALFVMMLALTSGRAAVGLYLITIFSVGLAAALMTVGIVMVRSRLYLNRYSPNNRLVQVLPVLSSMVILLVGTGFLVNGLVKYGILEIHLG